MAEYWVDPTRPNDTGDGLSLGAAKKTIPAGLALLVAKGDILNLVNSATHDWPTSETDVTIPAGTSYSDPSCTIRGTDTSGNAAWTTVAPTGSGAHRMVKFRDPTAYTITENLIFDASSQAADVAIYSAVRWRDQIPPQGPHKVRYCQMIGAASGAMAAGVRQLAHYDSGGIGNDDDQGQVEYCYIQNAGDSRFNGGGQKFRVDFCVFINDSGTARTGPLYDDGTLGASEPDQLVQLVNCTIYDDGGSDVLTDVLFANANTGVDRGTATVHSNLVWVETSATLANFMAGGVAATGVAHIGTMDYNVLLGGPSVSSGDLQASGWYEIPWDANDDDAVPPDTQTNDTVAYGQADTAAFNDPSSTFAWVLPNGLSTTIIKDLRPIAYKTAGLAGITPGALPPAETDYTVVVVSDLSNPEPEENVQFTITISNSGTAATGVEVTALLPSGVTYVSHSPSVGSYVPGTGVWTVGNLADSASETLTVNAQVDADQAGNTIVYTATQSAGDPATDPDSSDNTDSATLSVIDIDDPGDPGGEGVIPFLDVFPIYADVWKIDVNMWFKTKKNRVTQRAIRQNVEGRSIREISFRAVELAPSTTLSLNIGGIQRGRYLMMESTDDVVMSIGSPTLMAQPEATFLFIGGGNFEEVQLVNNSSTETATIIIGVTD